MRLSRTLRHLGLLVIWTAAACGGGSSPSEPSTSPDTTPANLTAQAGGGETARVDTNVPTAPAVRITNSQGSPLSGIAVTFSVESGGGSITGANASTNSNGVARVGSWTLGSTAGENLLQAAVVGYSDLSMTFSATARWPHWTVMVYMAADNNLTLPGIRDIDEMEAAGQDPEVQVLVQAEFSPTQLQLLGCDPSCFNRPDYDTFRYVVGGSDPEVTGPNGPANGIGNRNMTDPAELGAFVQWAKDTAPAEHYALVLWNHGGGYSGLIQDETSAGSEFMSIQELPAALSNAGTIDVIDFDMCLMAGYETLRSIRNVTDYAIFSEALVPGAGNPYQTWIETLHLHAAEEPAAVSMNLVEAFHDAYQGSRPSTTKSAYSLAQYQSFESDLDALADLLRSNLSTLQSPINAALENTQKYEQPELTDLVTFLDSLRLEVADPAIQSAIDELRSSATASSFRLNNRYRNGSAVGLGGSNDVGRSTGLHVVLPRGVGADRFADSGSRSFAAYEALYPDRPWTLFLRDWVASQTQVTYTDQGNSPFQGYLVWDSASVRLEAEVDLWILEPSGNLFIPWLGSVTPNGTLTNDSYYDSTWYEGYLTNRFVENGRYRFYAHLYRDPNDHRPIFDVQYRYGFSGSFTSLYDPDYPQLSLQNSWLDDPDPTFTEAESGAYTDLKYAAYLDIGTTASPSMSAPRSEPMLTTQTAPSRPTPEQLETVQRELEERGPAEYDALTTKGGEPSRLLEVPR